MPSRVETVQELKTLFKQAFIPVPPYEGGGPQGPPQGDPSAQGPPPAPAQAPPAEAPPAPGAPPQGGPQSPTLPPEVASIINEVVTSQQTTMQKLKELETKFEQDKILRDKDRENHEKRRQLIETMLPVAATS